MRKRTDKRYWIGAIVLFCAIAIASNALMKCLFLHSMYGEWYLDVWNPGYVSHSRKFKSQVSEVLNLSEIRQWLLTTSFNKRKLEQVELPGSLQKIYQMGSVQSFQVLPDGKWLRLELKGPMDALYGIMIGLEGEPYPAPDPAHEFRESIDNSAYVWESIF